ncbi:Glycoprotein 3-alpha-L-fucosyltransferase A [Echinococcus granulosus]|uniref:Fucosyltransferase n=1 Tax=Echinococcus granulosus TaxID=6210 RepID=W6UNS8_ECHGR|nr:Glycoprotein 3-alpha-L-fucosyltransferase A [Echinococcus granulosus]EUB55019.1 Glycoprotein 3-alpha-L-fucosyltransferase A [Echinococcus granulosus]
MAKSPVPAVYSLFLQNKNPRYRFTAEETAFMLSKSYVHLLPPHHWRRRKLIAWAVSNLHASNNRAEYANAVARFIPVRHDMIPVVLGAFKDDYESALPPHSYINVDDYKSIRELTDFLLYLDTNDTAYAAYFAWKEHGRICLLHDVCLHAAQLYMDEWYTDCKLMWR